MLKPAVNGPVFFQSALLFDPYGWAVSKMLKLGVLAPLIESDIFPRHESSEGNNWLSIYID